MFKRCFKSIQNGKLTELLNRHNARNLQLIIATSDYRKLMEIRRTVTGSKCMSVLWFI